MLTIPPATKRRPVVEIRPSRLSATVIFNPFRFVLSLTPDFWEPIIAEVKRFGCRPRLGPEALVVRDVPLTVAPELARTIALLATGHLRQSSLWLSDDDGEPPPLVGYADKRSLQGATNFL